ncbi:helix-turn-helix domain-containing protein [Chryseobacterium elymi]|uniref:Helix-turn-helix domain-containing protein n=1 Tax=Chryseobacterium elymi TaxID=395936 RepID=A0A3D9DJG1_9FLAO|nr:helix-turn-helix domain-containing protein [Chryseobacterium elymi]REC78109.1 helix-turn-helix domain-containing protein [Chryseobacterium elymi]
MRIIDTNTKPDYNRIYQDILDSKYPHKKEECRTLLEKKELSLLDIIQLNDTIFGTKNMETEAFNQQHRSYDRQTIFEILDYQKKNKLSNSQLARHFKLSRNTVAKWKKMYF